MTPCRCSPAAAASPIFGPARPCIAAVLVSLSAAAVAAIPVIQSTSVDATCGVIVINGQGLGSSPMVMLGAFRFPTVSATGTQIVAGFPAGMPISSFTTGTYFLVLPYANQLPSVFTLSLGTGGSPGPVEPAGPAWATRTDRHRWPHGIDWPARHPRAGRVGQLIRGLYLSGRQAHQAVHRHGPACVLNTDDGHRRRRDS